MTQDKKDKLLYELFLLTIALEAFSKSEILCYDEQVDLCTEHGFCHYFSEIFDVWIYIDDQFVEALPNLWRTAPFNKTKYWFDRGDAKKRVMCLDKAILAINKKLIKMGEKI